MHEHALPQSWGRAFLFEALCTTNFICCLQAHTIPALTRTHLLSGRAALRLVTADVELPFYSAKSNIMSETGVKTDEKKQHFDDIYIAEDPVPFKERILDDLHYVSDNFNRQTFDRLILPWAQDKARSGPVNYVDLAGCFGNTTMACLNGMDYEGIRDNWKDSASAKTVNQPRRFDANVSAIDISGNALAYGKSAGIYDQTIEADLNQTSFDVQSQVDKAVSEADIMISTAALVYLEPEAISRVLDAFNNGKGEGYLLVNFLNPFGLEVADSAKRALLERFEFVGSMASRHRLMAPIERENYPGEEWSMLEIWVLKRTG